MSDEKGNEKGDEKLSFDWLPSGGEPLADGEYDAIVLGTGLTECIMSGLLSVRRKETSSISIGIITMVLILHH